MTKSKMSETVNRVYQKSGDWRVYPKIGELRVKSEELSLSGNYLNAINIENIEKTHSRNFSTLHSVLNFFHARITSFASLIGFDNSVFSLTGINAAQKFASLSTLKNKTAFTLAEVLITLGVIGVVAAITMPMLITNINDRANSERHANIAYKITQAMEQMRAHGKLTAYDSTSAFVDELQKYLKITKRCDADHIAECWPTETVIDANGNEYNVADCKQRKNLLAGSDSEDENVGLILADGASIILTYDPTAAPMDIGDKITASNKSLPVGKNKNKDFAYTTNVTRSIDFVTDVNGKKGPNSETRENKIYDIRQFTLAQFVTTTDPTPICEDYNGICIHVAGVASNWSPANCVTSSADYAGADICGPHPSEWAKDYWAGAKKLCAQAGMNLPTVSQLLTIYANRANYTQLASYQATGWFWSSQEYPGGLSYWQHSARGVNFSYGTAEGFNKNYCYSSNIIALCVGP